MLKQIYLIFIILFISTQAFTQNNEVRKAINQSFQNGEATSLSIYLNSLVNLELKQYDANYSKKQSMVILQEFYDQNPVKSFSINHSGSSNDGTKYFIATYQSGNTSYRVYFLLKNDQGQYLIHQIQFEEE